MLVAAMVAVPFWVGAAGPDYEQSLRSLLEQVSRRGVVPRPEVLAGLAQLAGNEHASLATRKRAADAGVDLARRRNDRDGATNLLVLLERLVSETPAPVSARDSLSVAGRSADLGDFARARPWLDKLVAQQAERDPRTTWHDLAEWGRVLCLTGDAGRGLATYQTALERAGTGAAEARDRWNVCSAAITNAINSGDRKHLAAFIDTANRGCEAWVDASVGRDAVQRLMAEGKYDDALFCSRIRCALLGSRNSVQDALGEVVAALLAAGRTQEALVEAVRFLGFCDIRSLDVAIATVTRALEAAHSNDTATILRYIDFQQFGPEGRDGIVGTADDLASPLAGVRPAGQPGYEPVAMLLAQIPPARCGRRAWAHALLGDSDKALGAARCAYGLAMNQKDITEAAYDVASAIKAVDGHARRANQYLVFQRYGSAGPDGRGGTPDDVKDPLEGVPLTVDPAWDEAARREIAGCRQTYDDLRRKARLQIASGHAADALESVRQAYRVRPILLEALSESVGDTAMALRAVDGNVFRANTYLLFMKHGKPGPDGKSDTEDDLVNPLQD